MRIKEVSSDKWKEMWEEVQEPADTIDIYNGNYTHATYTVPKPPKSINNAVDNITIQVQDIDESDICTKMSVLSISNNDSVNHPSHYGGKYEVIDILKDKLTEEQFYGFLCGNVIKYMTRWQNKNGLEDLKKAEWYLSYLIKEKENGESVKEKTE